MATILVTCAGSGVGQSVLDSLNLLRVHKLIGCDTNRDVYAYHFCDSFFIVPNIYSLEYIDFLLNLCIRENVDLIIPGHDHELLLLSENISKFTDQGIKVIVSRPDLIEISRTGLPKVMNVGGTNISLKDYCYTVVDCIGLPDKKKFLHFGDGMEVSNQLYDQQ